MREDNNPNFFSAVAELMAAYIQRLTDLLSLAALEAQLAIKTLVFIAILIFVLSSALTACWLSLSALLFFALTSFHFSTLSACGIVAAANLLTLSFILFTINKIKDNLFFPSTCKQLHINNNESAEVEHVRITAKN